MKHNPTEDAPKTQPILIQELIKRFDLPDDAWSPRGWHMAKIDPAAVPARAKRPQSGHLILVTAIHPTPAGEGKTTVTLGLTQAFHAQGYRVMGALREPSLGPVFGRKGGATGGGQAQVIPQAEINLHFTGDLHALTAANNLMAALLDNHLQQGNPLKIDPRKIVWKRCIDLNDRSLRHCIIGLGGSTHGYPREENFQITVATELMAVFCLAHDLADLKTRIGQMRVAQTLSGDWLTVSDFGVQGALCALLVDAFKPNLVQAIGGAPVLIHGGPFANIAHGCSSLRSTQLALDLADVVVTEAGFGADLGAEKFVDIKCRLANLKPAAAVLVATLKALKYAGGCLTPAEYNQPNQEALSRGLENLLRHIQNLSAFNLPVIVALNPFDTDSEAEQTWLIETLKAHDITALCCPVYQQGGGGAQGLVEALKPVLAHPPAPLNYAYPLTDRYTEKIERLAQQVYGAAGVSYGSGVQKQLEELDRVAPGLPICVAKTPYSFSDQPSLIGSPRDFVINIRGCSLSAGAGFVVVYAGNILTLPGLSAHPAAEHIDVEVSSGRLIGIH